MLAVTRRIHTIPGSTLNKYAQNIDKRTENFKGLIKSPSHKFREDAVSVESNNTGFLISFENFLKDILKSAPYLFDRLINGRVVKYPR